MTLLPFCALAVAVEPRVDDAVHPVSPLHVSVTRVDVPAAASTGWTLQRPDGSRLDASDLRERTRAASLIPEGWPYPSVVERTAILAFAVPWGTGAGSYALSDGENSWSFEWDPALDLAPALHLDPLGARPDAPEILALASTWNVDGAPITLTDADTWSVVDEADGAVVRTGSWSLRAPYSTTEDDAYGNSYTLANVYQADLTGLPTGNYHLRWEGVGRSWSFPIAGDAWDEPFRTVLRGLLHQRCGFVIDPANSAWGHAACHLGRVELTTADYQVVGEDAFAALPDAGTGIFVDAPGGYHDAADYDRNIGHLAVVHALVELYELDPGRFSHDALGLPESGNGLPDVLDEALWAMSPWVGLQEEAGGVPGCIGTIAYPGYDLMPDEDEGPWYACAADPNSSYRFAAASAALSRALDLAGEADGALWLERAERAWAWAEAHPASAYDTSVAAAHAAAELTRTTGSGAYAEAFREAGPFSVALGWSYASWDPWVWDDGLWAMVNTGNVAPDLREASRRVLLERADAAVAGTDVRSVPVAVHPYGRIAFGSGTTPRESRALFRAYSLTANPDYLRVGTNTAANSLGLNATGTGWVTGLGPNAVRHPLHTPSLADGIDEPVPGLPIYGPAVYDESAGILDAALDAMSPPVSDWPFLERFADVDYVPQYNEFTVAESLAPTIFAFGFLAELAPVPEPEPGADPAGDSDVPGSVPDVADASGCGCAATMGASAWGVSAALIWALRRRADQPSRPSALPRACFQTSYSARMQVWQGR